MFFKHCLRKKYKNFTFNPMIYCFVHSNISPNCAQRLLNNIVSGVSKQAENGIGNRRASFLSVCNTVAQCSSQRSICSSASVWGSNAELSYSSISTSSRKYFYKIKPHYSSESVRWYNDCKVEKSLTKDVNLFDRFLEETCDVHNSYEHHERKSPDSVGDHFKAETDVVYNARRCRTGSFYGKKTLSVENYRKLSPSSATNSKNVTAISHMINIAQTSSEVLEIYEEQQNELQLVHYDLIVRRLTAVMDRSQCKKIRCHPMMVQLMDQITHDCSRYDPEMLMALLKFLHITDMPVGSPIVHTTLQVLRKKFNHLSLKQLLFAGGILKNMMMIPVGNALNMAIPLALEYRYLNDPLPADLTNFHLINGLSICANSDTVDSMSLAEKFLMALYEQEQILGNLSAGQTLSLICVLQKIFLRWDEAQGRPTQDLSDDNEFDVATEGENNKVQAHQQMELVREVLLKETLQYISKNIYKFSRHEVEKVLNWLSYSYKRGDTCAYNQPMLRAYVRRAINQDWPLRSLANGVMWMLTMNEADESLLQALVEKIHRTSQEELLATELLVMPLVHALATSSTFARHSQQEQHALLDRLLHHPSADMLRQTGGRLPVHRLGVDLAYLNYFQPDVHRKILDIIAADIEKLGYDGIHSQAKRQLCTLLLAHQLLNNKHDWLQVDDDLLAASKESVLSEHYSSSSRTASRARVREVLLQALSCYGPDSVVTAVHTRHGVCVDHVIVVRGECEVVPQPTVPEGRVCLDDLLVPAHARVLGVLQVGPDTPLTHYSKLQSRARLHVQLLAAEGVTAVPLLMPQYALHCRTHQEKTRYVTAALAQHRLYL